MIDDKALDELVGLLNDLNQDAPSDRVKAAEAITALRARVGELEEEALRWKLASDNYVLAIGEARRVTREQIIEAANNVRSNVRSDFVFMPSEVEQIANALGLEIVEEAPKPLKKKCPNCGLMMQEMCSCGYERGEAMRPANADDYAPKAAEREGE